MLCRELEINLGAPIWSPSLNQGRSRNRDLRSHQESRFLGVKPKKQRANQLCLIVADFRNLVTKRRSNVRLTKKVFTCDTKYFGVLIFAFFVTFPAIRKSTFPQIKSTANIFPSKIYSRVNILQLKFATQKYNTKKSCLFNHNFSFIQKQNVKRYTAKGRFIVWKYVFLVHVLNKNENIINAEYCVLSENR